MYKRYFKWLDWSVAVGFLVALLLFAYISNPYWSGYLEEAYKDFTVENWSKANEHQRLYMAEDFLKKYPIDNMDKQEVVKLLGEPNQSSGSRLDYVLALTLADYMMLSFELDAGGKVLKAYIHES